MNYERRIQIGLIVKFSRDVKRFHKQFYHLILCKFVYFQTFISAVNIFIFLLIAAYNIVGRHRSNIKWVCAIISWFLSQILNFMVGTLAEQIR